MAFADHCQTAQDVLEAARRVRERRRASYHKKLEVMRAPKIVPKEPLRFDVIGGPVVARFQEQINAEAPQQKPITIREIQEHVCEVGRIKMRDLIGQSRHKEFVIPRQIAFMLSRYFTSRSLPEIGRRFGDRDHTTVMHSCVKLEPVLRDVKARLSDRAPLSEWVTAAFEAHERIRPKGKGHKLRIGDMPAA